MMKYYYLACLIISLIITAFYIYYWNDRYSLYFTLIQIICTVACAASYFRSISTNSEQVYYLHCLSYIFTIFYISLAFSGVFSSFNLGFTKWFTVVEFFVEIIIFVIILTSNYTGAYFKSVNPVYNNGFTTVNKEYGPMHKYLYVFLFLIFIVYTLMAVVVLYKRKKTSSKIVLLVQISVFIYFFDYVINKYILGFGDEQLCYIICQIIIYYVAKISPAYSYTTYLNSEEISSNYGIISFDYKHRFISCNSTAIKWFPELNDLYVEKEVFSVLGINARFSEWFDRLNNNKYNYLDIVESNGLFIKFDCSIRIINNKKYYCFVLTNYTAQSELMRIVDDSINKKSMLSETVDPAVVKEMISSDSINMEYGKEIIAAVMFADLRNFTSIAENLSPKETLQILNKYLSLAEKIIHDNGGIVDKYIGDAIMAYWIDFDGDGKAAVVAANTALQIKEAVVGLEDEIYAAIYRELFFGIGINYGNVVLGSVGSNEFKNYTIIGDVVNTAARLENIAPKGCIYTSADFIKKLEGKVPSRIVENDIRIKGKSDLIDIYEIIKDEQKNTKTISLLEKYNNNRATLYICGSRGSYSVSGERFSKFGGETTCFVIKIKNRAIIVDCGSGLINAKNIIADCTEIDVILTHMHYDHCIGLINWSVFPKDVNIKFYGNFKHWNGKNSISDLFRAPFWPIDLSSGELIDVPDDNSEIDIGFAKARFFDASHPNGAKYVLLEINNKKLFIMADAEDYDKVDIEYINNCDYLIYDGMYDDSEYKQYIGWGHSTWQAGIRLAQKCNIKYLIISHHNTKSSDGILLERERKARIMFPNTTFARVDDKFTM